ncbi:MAG TPA: response regulator [Coleofasciculaceae cyanobacterium]
MKLKTKFVSGFLAVASLVALSGIINIKTRNDVKNNFNQITEKTAPELIALDQIKVASLRMMTEASSYALIQVEAQQNTAISRLEAERNKEEEEEEEEEFNEAREDLEEGLTAIKSLADTPEKQEIYEQLTQGKTKLAQIGQSLIDLKQKGAKGNAILLKRQEFEAAEEEFLKVIDRAIQANLEALALENKEANNSATSSLIVNLTAIAAVMATSVILGLILAERITKPIIQLKDAATKIGQGDFDTRVDVQTQDELSILADAFNQMVGQLQETTVSKSYLDNIIRSLSDALIVLNQEGRVMSFNNAALALAGYPANELRDRHINTFLRENFSDIGFEGRKETNFLAKDGRQIPVSVALSAMQNAAGKVEGTVCLVQDVSARKQAEEALRRQALIFETIYDGVVLTDLGGRIIDWNPAAERIFGYHKAEVLGTTPGIVYRPEEAAELVQQMLDNLRDKGRWAREIEFIRKDGTMGVCETVVVPLRDEYGQLAATIGVHRDVTDRKQYENQLVEAREAALDAARAKAQFLANMSHEIRTPMNGVLGMGELLLTTELNPRQLDFVRTLQVSGEHLLRVINDVLDFSKLEAGEMRLDSEDFDLNLCLEEVLDLCNSQAAVKDLELGLLIDTEVPRQLMGDAGRLRQILTNLVGNAIKFTDQGDIVIHVCVSRQSDQKQQAQLRFAVKDTGIGIAPENLQKLFKSFSQVDTSITRNHGGTGLGLAICKQLVEMMGGEIGVESQLGVGSTFWFTANFTTVAPELAKPASDRTFTKGYISPEALTGKRVLVVDDRPINRQIVQHQLTAKGMEVDEASNGIAALNTLQAAAEAGTPYDVVLIDMKMPKIDGSTLGRLILAEPDWAHPKLVLMTSMHAGDSAQPLLKSGFSDYLVKPVKESQLLHSLVKLLAPEQHLSVVHELSGEKQLTSDAGKQKSLKILLVEDTPINLKLVQHQVRLLGHEWDAAENGKVALDKLAQHHYDIVLMDCQMPVMDGYEATKMLRQREGTDRHTVVIGMTAYAMQGDREKCLAAGMDDYLSKPVMVKDLKEMLQQWSSTLNKYLVDTTSCERIAEEHRERNGKSLAPNQELVDWTHLQEICGGDSSFQLEMVQAFVKDAARFLGEAKQALAAKDYVTLANKAHQIKGGSASVAVRSMSEVAAKLHKQAQANNLEGASELVAELEKILEQLKALRNVI